jgi:DNA-directed RNA polymerase subunit RPC12/RpoP
MNVTFHINPLFSITAEGADHKALFEQIAGLAELFQVDTCGQCKSHAVLPVVRNNEGVKYYEYKCQDCGARLSLGQAKTNGTLYPRRVYHKQHPDVQQGRASAGDRMNAGGWEKWSKTPTPAPVEDSPRF